MLYFVGKEKRMIYGNKIFNIYNFCADFNKWDMLLYVLFKRICEWF